jgi:hypothetical protein
VINKHKPNANIFLITFSSHRSKIILMAYKVFIWLAGGLLSKEN